MSNRGAWIGGALVGAVIASVVALAASASSDAGDEADARRPRDARAERSRKAKQGHRRDARPRERGEAADEEWEEAGGREPLDGSPAARVDDDLPPVCVEHVRPVRRKLSRALTRLRRLEHQARTMTRELENERTYDLSKEMLEALADRCELRWDHPKVWTDQVPHLSPEDTDELELDRPQQVAVNEELRAWNRHMLAEMRRLYAEATGDDNVGSLTPEAMVAEITDKSPIAERKLVFQRLSAERAGWMEPPASLEERSAAERLYRLVTSGGDRLQAAIAERVGGEVAQRMRDLHGGYGSTHRSRYGCP